MCDQREATRDGESLDVFVSYKSENVAIARAVAEGLVANGARVWFAEYEVLLSNYADFQAAIYLGIDRSRFALLFTNNAWAESRHCDMEATRIFRQLPSDHVLEVRVPAEDKPRQKHPGLALAHGMEYREDPGEVIRFALKHMDLRVESPCIPDPGRVVRSPGKIWCDDVTGIEVPLGPFVERRLMPSECLTNEYLKGYFHSTYTIGEPPIRMIIAISPMQVAPRPVEVSDRILDDREVYEEYRRYAETFVSKSGITPKGLHLHFWDQRSNMALTCIDRSAAEGEYVDWERRYIMNMVDPLTGETGEVNVIFGVKLPDGEMGLRVFCQLTPYMDQLVALVRHNPVKGLSDARNYPYICLKLCTLGALTWGISHYAGTNTDGTGLCLTSFALGAAVTEFIVSLFAPRLMMQFRQLKMVFYLRALFRGMWTFTTAILFGAAVFLSHKYGFTGPWCWAIVGSWAMARGLVRLNYPEKRR